MLFGTELGEPFAQQSDVEVHYEIFPWVLQIRHVSFQTIVPLISDFHAETGSVKYYFQSCLMKQNLSKSKMEKLHHHLKCRHGTYQGQTIPGGTRLRYYTLAQITPAPSICCRAHRPHHPDNSIRESAQAHQWQRLGCCNEAFLKNLLKIE